MVNRKGEGRGRDYTDVALIKRMIQQNFPRDRIMSFFVQPGEVLSPAVISDIRSGKIGKDIEPASEADAKIFIARRMGEGKLKEAKAFGPLSELRIQEVLSLVQDGQTSLPGFESLVVEYKQSLPVDRAERIKVAKTATSFANTRGGYIFFGVSDQREICGLPDLCKEDREWVAIAQAMYEYFTPQFLWDKSVVSVGGRKVAAIFVSPDCDKPIIAKKDYADIICSGQIYARYSGLTKGIEAGDLLALLAERDRRVAARTASQLPPPPFTA